MRTLMLATEGGACPTMRERQISAPGASSPGQAVEAADGDSGPYGMACPGLPYDGMTTACDDMDTARATMPCNRHAGTTPSSCGTTPIRRRRSSWAAGFCPTLLTGAPPGGLEDLSPTELYRQFELIRDAVLKKLANNGRSARDSKLRKCSDGETGAESQWAPDTLNHLHLQQRARGCSLDDMDATQGPDFDPNAFESAVPPGFHSVCQPGFAEHPWSSHEVPEVVVAREPSATGLCSFTAGAARADASEAGKSPLSARDASSLSAPCLVVEIPGEGDDHERQQYLGPSSPGGMIDLHQYYRSPTASSEGAERQCSPFEGAVNYASDLVAYNTLYSARSPRPGTARTVSPGGSVQPNEGTRAAALKLEACVSMPRTDSLFSLQPSCEPQGSLGHMLSQAWCMGPRMSVCGGGHGGGARAQMLVLQEELGASVDIANSNAPCADQQQQPGLTSCLEQEDSAKGDTGTASVCGRGTLPRTSAPNPGAAHNSFGDSTNPDDGNGGYGGGDLPDEVNSSDVLCSQEPGEGRGDIFTPDYLKAVQSAATRTLLPLARLPTGDSISAREPVAASAVAAAGLEGGHGSRSSGALLVTRAAGATEAATGGPEQPLVQRYGSEGHRNKQTPYVTLPLPQIPSEAVIQPTPAPLVSLRSSNSVAISTTATIRKCLEKNIPFAVMLVEDFAAVVTAAELHDAPLAYHILSTQCSYYPGLGRPAASSGSSSPTCSSSPTASSANVGATVAGLKGNSGGFASAILAKRANTAASEAAATAVQQLLAEEKPLHVMSPCEYQRLIMAAQYGVRQLHDILVAQPAAPATEAAEGAPGQQKHKETALAAPKSSRNMALPPLSGASGGRRHRRGGSIGSEISFRANVVRFQSSGDTLADSASATARMASSASASPSSTPRQGVPRVREFLEAAQLGNICRVAYLVERFVDVNATDSAAPAQQHHQPPGGPGVRGPRGGAFAGGGGMAVGGRTALHYAAEAGSFGVVQLLLHQGAFVGVRDGTGRTAQELARRKGHLVVAQLLKVAVDRRRDVVRSCAAESRGTPPTPRSTALVPKQLRSSSAAASNTTTAAAAPAAAPVASEGEGSGKGNGGNTALPEGAAPQPVFILNAGPAPVQAADSRQTISSMYAGNDDIRSSRRSPAPLPGSTSSAPTPNNPTPGPQLDAAPATSMAATHVPATIPEVTLPAATGGTPRASGVDGRMDSLLAHDTLPASVAHGARRKSSAGGTGSADPRRKGRQRGLLACFACVN